MKKKEKDIAEKKEIEYRLIKYLNKKYPKKDNYGRN